MPFNGRKDKDGKRSCINGPGKPTSKILQFFKICVRHACWVYHESEYLQHTIPEKGRFHLNVYTQETLRFDTAYPWIKEEFTRIRREIYETSIVARDFCRVNGLKGAARFRSVATAGAWERRAYLELAVKLTARNYPFISLIEMIGLIEKTLKPHEPVKSKPKLKSKTAYLQVVATPSGTKFGFTTDYKARTTAYQVCGAATTKIRYKGPINVMKIADVEINKQLRANPRWLVPNAGSEVYKLSCKEVDRIAQNYFLKTDPALIVSREEL